MCLRAPGSDITRDERWDWTASFPIDHGELSVLVHEVDSKRWSPKNVRVILVYEDDVVKNTTMMTVNM